MGYLKLTDANGEVLYESHQQLKEYTVSKEGNILHDVQELNTVIDTPVTCYGQPLEMSDAVKEMFRRLRSE